MTRVWGGSICGWRWNIFRNLKKEFKRKKLLPFYVFNQLWISESMHAYSARFCIWNTNTLVYDPQMTDDICGQPHADWFSDNLFLFFCHLCVEKSGLMWISQPLWNRKQDLTLRGCCSPFNNWCGEILFFTLSHALLFMSGKALSV